MSTEVTQNNSALLKLQMNIAELEQQLLVNDPQMPQYLKMIHSCLLQQPELVHILKDEDRAVIFKGLSSLSNVVVAAVEKKTVAKRLAQHTEDDI